MKIKLNLKGVFKKYNKHLISSALIAISAALSFLTFKPSLIRLKEALRDIGYSLKYYVLNMFLLDGGKVTVTDISAVKLETVLPFDYSVFKENASVFFKRVFDKENFTNFLQANSSTLAIIFLILNVCVLLFFIFKLAIKLHIEKFNNNYGKESKALKVFKRVENFFAPAAIYVKNFLEFFTCTKFKTIFLLVWAINLNFIAPLLEVTAFLFYFVFSFDFANIYMQFYKLSVDFAIALNGLPAPAWIIVVWIFIIRYRKNKGLDRLYHMEAKNTGFVKELPTVNVIHGLMGGGKGLVMTDIAQTAEKVFRENAKEIMRKYDLMFPEFPWILFEKDLKNKFLRHFLYSFATIEKYIAFKKKYFYFALNSSYFTERGLCDIVYGYDFNRYGLTYYNNLYNVDLFTALDTYAKAFFIYTLKEFKVANYAIRNLSEGLDLGNFPLWNYDYFSRNGDDVDNSGYCKILDQDILRKGKKVVENNPLADTFEFGIIVMTELDKERGNQNVTNEMKAKADETNQKNDLFNFGMKLDRHSSTVDFKPFVMVLFDLQRIFSTNADLQELGMHLGIGEKDSNNLSLPLFFVEEFLYGLISPLFERVYDEYRFYRGDNTLFMYLFKKVLGGFINYYARIYNFYGFDVHHLAMEDVKTGEINKHDYYLLYKKAKAKVYTTDCYVDYYRRSAIKKLKGISDYPEYKDVKASLDELKMQNAYFVNNLESVYSDKTAAK